MKVELFPFQKMALFQLRRKTAEALGSYQRTHTPQVLSFTAPTGAENTASCIQRSIPCRTCEATIQCQLIYFFSELLPQKGVQAPIMDHIIHSLARSMPSQNRPHRSPLAPGNGHP